MCRQKDLDRIYMSTDIKINRINKKKDYAVCMLVYPDKFNKESEWNYFFGAVMVVHQLKKNTWFRENCDFVILTPEIGANNGDVLRMIKLVFDAHAIYKKSLQLDNNLFEYSERWHGVFNKLYFWDSENFNYKRLMICDTDIFIHNPLGYVKVLTESTGIVSGSYEHDFINKNNDSNLLKFDAIIETKYTSYTWKDNKSHYNMINAGVLSIVPDIKTLREMLADLKGGWKLIEKRHPALLGKIGKNIFPEQEYLTGFFSGKWHNLPLRDYLSVIPTNNHYCMGPTKYWSCLPKKIDVAALIKKSCTELFIKYPSLCKICKINKYYLS